MFQSALLFLALVPGDDQTRTLQARHALEADAALAGLNLGVLVQQETVTLWGPVPDMDLAQQAESLLRGLPGVTRVRNDCHLLPPPDPLIARVEELMNQASTMNEESLIIPRPAAGRQSHFHGGSPGIVPPPLPLPLADLMSHHDEPPLDPNVRLLPPVLEAIIERPEGQLVTRPKVELGLPERLELVRAHDQRFRGVTVTLHRGVVYLSGYVPQASDIWDLADQIAGIPGVARVVVKEIDTR